MSKSKKKVKPIETKPTETDFTSILNDKKILTSTPMQT
jgi:hypothetical protein